MKKIKQKKMLGTATAISAAISGISNLTSNISKSHQMNKQAEEQEILRKVADTNAKIANMNQLVNNDMSWAYDKFKPVFKCGGKKRMKADLGKFKSRFGK